MKDKLRIVTIIMLTALIVLAGLLYGAVTRLNNRMDNLENGIQSEVQNACAQLSSDINQALLSEKFITVELRSEFPKILATGRKAEGSIYFELAENGGYEEIYVVIYGTQNDGGLVLEAASMGNLRYSAEAELDIDDYTYYVVGKDAEGSETMLSAKQQLDLTERAYEPVILYGGSGYDSNNGEFSADGVLQIDNSTTGIQKVELKLAMESDYIQYKENYEDYIIKTMDITESITEADPETLDVYTAFLEDYYTTYTYEVSTVVTEEDGYDPNRGSSIISYAVVVTFDDGVQAVVFR